MSCVFEENSFKSSITMFFKIAMLEVIFQKQETKVLANQKNIKAGPAASHCICQLCFVAALDPKTNFNKLI
jgi:hypothetical protein